MLTCAGIFVSTGYRIVHYIVYYAVPGMIFCALSTFVCAITIGS